jgi:site-specific DNA-cytosine methylase
MHCAQRFRWPELKHPLGRPPAIADILQSDQNGIVPILEKYRLKKSLWSAVKGSEYYRMHPEHRVPSLAGPSNTIRSSYFSGAKLYSQFVPMPAPPTLEENHAKDVSDSLPTLRFFTPRECARLQGFPDTFVLSGEGRLSVPESAQYQAIGNAVSPPVIALIVQALLRTDLVKVE